MRNLVTIQRILDLQPIPNADAIEVATVLGWHCVVRKGEFEINDLCVYFEVDSFLPVRPEFEILAKGGIKKMEDREGYRLRTIRLRGQISQGLCLPISIFSELTNSNVGDDVSEILGIVKYEPPIPVQLRGVVKGPFPSFVPKTDETRIQAFPEILTKYQGIIFFATEKIDGCSTTLYIQDGELNVCSRNLNLKESDENLYWQVARQIRAGEKLLGTCVALQGEIVGEGIQGNKLGIKGHQFYAFSAYDFGKQSYLDYADFIQFCLKRQFVIVPQIESCWGLPITVDSIVNVSIRKSLINSQAWAEGIVVRPLKEMTDPDLGRLSFKVINPEFLLEHKE